jgi:hypothetical protein
MINGSGVVQNGSCDFLDCETLLCCERGCVILRGILGLGAVDRRDVPGRGMLWMLGGVMLELAQDVLNVTMHGNVACSLVVIPFQGHARVYHGRPVGC